MKKIAILNILDKRKSAGGPAGYLNNLYEGFAKITNSGIPDFIYLYENKESSNDTVKKAKFSVKSYLPGLREILYFYKQGFIFKKKLMKKCLEYDVIHVHTSEAVVYLRSFAHFKGFIVFTPHRPEKVSDEKIELLKKKKKRPYLCVRIFLNRMEKKSYKYADGFIFPCEQAAKIYNSFPGFSKYKQGKRIAYAYTGIEKKDVKINAPAYKMNNGIPQDAFVIGYIGRHNNIKGYDRLVSISQWLYEKGIYVLVAGNYDQESIPKYSNWIEKGYINDAENLINACDCLIVPNRNTYFDLVVLEALSHGKVVVTTNTGGNIDLANDTKAIYLFEENNLVTAIEGFLLLPKEQKEELFKDALRFYNEKCTCEKFAINYLNALQNVIE